MTEEAEVEDGAVSKRGFLYRVADRIYGDSSVNAEALESDAVEFPYRHAQPYARVIGSLFKLKITKQDLTDAYGRYPLARRIVDMPIEEAFEFGFTLVDDRGTPIPEETNTPAMNLYQKHKSKILRFSKLVQLFGHSELIYGFTDPSNNWPNPVEAEVPFDWTQPVPIDNESELKVSDKLPVEIEQLTTSFGTSSNTFDPSRFTFSMNPSLTTEDKVGDSVLNIVFNALDVQVHANWSIGQALWRNAGGLLALFAPKKTVKAPEKQSAIASIANHNARTVLYIPNGWAVKQILKSTGNMAIHRTYKVVLDEISAGCGIPTAILVGSQFRDPSEQDTRTYYRTVAAKQNNLLTPVLLDFFRKAQTGKMIPPGSINILWNPLEYLGPVDKKQDELQIKVIDKLIERIDSTEETAMTSPDLVKLYNKGRRK